MVERTSEFINFAGHPHCVLREERGVRRALAAGLVDVVAVVEAAADDLAGRGEGEVLHISVLARTLSGCQ